MVPYSSAEIYPSKEFDPLIRAVIAGQSVSWPNSFGKWESHFLQTAWNHGLQPLLYQKMLETRCPETWPIKIRTALEQEAKRQAVFDAMLQIELQDVLKALAEVGIYPLLMKGTPLSYTHYPFSPLRPRCDTDLLIQKNDLEMTTRALNSLGYHRSNSVSGELISHQFLFRKQCDNGIPFDLDIHWKITNPVVFSDSLSFEDLESQAVKVPALGNHARSLGSVHALLLACIHRVAHHGGNDRLIWLYDIHLLAEKMNREEFEKFTMLASDKRVKAVCLQGLRKAQQWFETNLLSDLMDRWLVTSESSPAEPSRKYLNPHLRRFGLLMLDLKGLSFYGKIKLIREHLFPPADYVLRHYSVSSRIFLPALYMHRIVTGAWKWATQ